MESKKIRRIVNIIGGAACALISTLFLFTVDIAVNISVYYLFGLAIFGLGGGLLQVIGSANLVDEEDFKPSLFLFISSLFGVLLIVILFALSNETTLLKVLGNPKKDTSFISMTLALNILIAFINTVICLVSTVLTSRTHFRWLNETHPDKFVKFKNVTNLVTTIVCGVFVLFGIVSLFVFPVIEGTIVTVEKATVDGIFGKVTTTIVQQLNGISAIFGGDTAFVTSTKLEYQLIDLPTSVEVVKGVSRVTANVGAMASFMLAFVGTACSITFAHVPALKKHFLGRLIPGLTVLFAGIVGLLVSGEIAQFVAANATKLVVGATYSAGKGYYD